MFNLDLSLIGWAHTMACLVALVAFVPAIVARKGGRLHRRAGTTYAFAYVALSLTALGVYSQQRFWFPHWLAVAGLAVLAVGWLAVRLKPWGWRYLHLTAMLLSAYNLAGGAVNEVFLRIRPLRALAGDNILTSQVVGITHAIVMTTFVILIAGYTVAQRRFAKQ